MFRGCHTAIVTPFTESGVDYDAFAKLIEFQIDGNVDGIVVVGTTGESPTLSMNEHFEVVDFVIKTVDKRCLVVAGTGGNSTMEAIELTKHAAASGADGTLQVTPYYNKPTQDGLVRHFSAIADCSDLPVILYNVPGRSSKEIEMDTVIKLSEHPNIVAVKEASGDVDRVSQTLNSCDLTVLSGDDSLTLPMMSVGAKGVISVASNILPTEVSAMVHAALKQNFQEALRIHKKLYPVMRDMFLESNPIPVKTALVMMGKLEEVFRLPMSPISEINRHILKTTLEEYGFNFG